MGKKHAALGWQKVRARNGLRRLIPESTPAALVLAAAVVVAALVFLYALLK